MKKFLLTLGLIGTLSASALAEDAFYLVGAFNDQTIPSQATESQIYALEYDPAAERYRGNFEIPADKLEFKVFTSFDTTWDDSDQYLGYYQNQFLLFNDKDCSLELSSIYSSNACCINWYGGEITIEIGKRVTDGDPSYFATLLPASQPDMPKVPDQIYVIGDFNNWQVPTAYADNGALPIAKSSQDDLYVYYNQQVEIPSGKANFAFYYDSPAVGEPLFAGITYNDWNTAPPFTFYKMPDGTNRLVGFGTRLSNSIDDICPAVLTNYTDNKLYLPVHYSLVDGGYPSYLLIRWDDAPVYDLPTEYYMLYEKQDGTREILPMDGDVPSNGYFYTKLTQSIYNRKS